VGRVFVTLLENCRWLGALFALRVVLFIYLFFIIVIVIIREKKGMHGMDTGIMNIE